MEWLKAILGAPAEVAASAYKAHLAKKTRDSELEDAKHERRIEVIKQGRVNEATWNMKSIENSGWKDEYLTIILSLPLILVFIPWFVPYIEQGFAVLEQTPFWYRSGIGVMIASAFGFQKYHKLMMDRKYT